MRGTVWNNLKGVKRKRGEGKQRFYKGGQAGSRGKYCKKGELEPSCELCSGEKEHKMAQNDKILSLPHPYLRKHTYERDFWYTCIK